MRYTSTMLEYRKQLNIAAFIITVALIGWLLLYKITSSDFWWHVKAGQVLRSTGWIHTDPFAYTREGLPYLATQSWLAQVILSMFYDFGSASGVIFLRFLLVALTFSVLLLIDRRSIWPNVFVILLALILLRPFLLDRPQLWTFLCFSLQLFFTIKFIESPISSYENRTKYLIKYLLPIWAVQVLWVNMHGAAALVTVALIGAAFLGFLVEDVRSHSPLPQTILRSWIYLLAIAGALVTLLFSPNGIGNLAYVQNLFSDQTKEFIVEWQAPVLSRYLQVTGVFWILALISLLWSRKHTIAFGTILIVFGLFACTAMRHLPLFVLAAVAISFASLKNTAGWQALLTAADRHKMAVLLLSAGILAALLGLNRMTRIHLIRSGTNTAGILEQYTSAYDFLERTQPSGHMFNSYDVGSYLLSRGYPDRKVFVDGRNVDYGYEFLRKTMDAAQDPSTWKQLEEEFGLTYAVFNYTPNRELYAESVPYANHLDRNPDWALVYIDDQIAVYFKRIPEHTELIDQYEYHFINPEKLDRGTVFQSIAQENVHALETELLRVSRSDAEGIKALLLLVKLYFASDLPDDALRVLSKTMERQPMHYEAYEIAGQVYEKAGRYEEAVQMFTKSMQYSSHLDASYDYARFAEVWEKAGHAKKAEQFRRKALLSQ